MALRRTEHARRPARAITAAATRLDPADREKARKETRKRPLDWQKQAFQFYDEVGEVRFGANWMANALSRLRLVPAYAEEPGMQPVPVGSAEEGADAKAPEPDRVAAQATLARIGMSEGGEAEIMRGFGLNLFVPGECYLIGRDDDETREEVWGIYSVEAVTVDGDGRYAIRPYPGARKPDVISLEDKAFVMRVSRRHPRYPDWPDSAMRGALDYCEDLRVLTAMIRAAATSRVPSKILGVPEEASFGSADAEDAETDELDPLTRNLIEHMSAPLKDPKSAAALVPFVLRLAGEDLDRVKVFDLTREIDRLALDLREETRRAFAASVDLPAEILTGRVDLNHWTMASVTEEAFRNHVEPYAQGIVDALTFGYFRPALAALKIEDPRQWSVSYDAADLVSSPDQSKDVQDAYDRGEVTGAYYRDVRGIPEDAAPDDEELVRRERLASIVGIARGNTAGPTRAAEPAAGAPAPVQQAAALLAPPVALVAAPLSPYAALSARLARAEMALLDRLRIVADEALHRALERAGSRLRSASQRNATAWAAIDGVPAHMVAATLGPAVVAALGTDVDGLLDGAWSWVEQRWNTLVEQAQRDALAATVELGRTTGFDAGEAAAFSTWSDRFAAARAEGARVLLDGLAALARERLFNPIAPMPEQGEWDTLSVPPRVVRRALQAAGRRAITAAAIEGDIAGLLSGEMMTDILAGAAAAEFGSGYVWMHGAPDRPLPGHEALDGVPFESWHDEVLANYEEFPDTEFYFPDDHDGCTCWVERIVERGTETTSRPVARSRVAREQATTPRLVPDEPQPNAYSFSGWDAWGKAHGIEGTDSILEAFMASGMSDAQMAAAQERVSELLQQYNGTLQYVRSIRSETPLKPYGHTSWNRGGTSRPEIGLNGDPTRWPGKALDVQMGWSCGPPDASGTLIHELGHSQHIGLENFGIPKAEFRVVSERAATTAGSTLPEGMGGVLGGNSQQNGLELFADAFKMLHHPAAELTVDERTALEDYAMLMNNWIAKATNSEVTEII